MEKLDELVSVVIPVYNSEKFLKKAIKSVLNQTYDNIEILAIDDGSTDTSLEILQKYSNKITILSQSNKGLASTLNAGIAKMHGKWFKWFSPDDLLYPNAVEILVNEIKKHSENTIIYSNWDIIDENDKKLRNFSESDYNDLGNFDFNIRLLNGQQINVNTTLIPSSLFQKGCIIQKLKDPVAIDYDFFLRASILYGTQFYLIKKPLIQYRINSNQLSHKNISKTLSYIKEIRNQILLQLDSSEKKRYTIALKEYEKNKQFAQKVMDTGLKFTTNLLPARATDRLLLFYLNKIRRSR